MQRTGKVSALRPSSTGTPASRMAASTRGGRAPTGTTGGGTAPGSRSPKRGGDDDRDEYLTNLKGQIYLLTIENEMLKQARGEPTSEGGEPMSAMYAHGATRAAEREKEAERAADSVAAAALPDELADLEAHMRSKYAQVEAKYQQDLADARRAAEALSTQCAAQSSLIAALKQEVASANDVIAQQKHLLHSSEATLGTELRRSRDESANLAAHIEALQKELENTQQVVTQRETSISDLRSKLAEAQLAKAAADQARGTTLENFARIYTALHVVLKKWREERIQRIAAQMSMETMRVARDNAEGRAETAESDAQLARGAQNEALVARDDALYAARQLRSRLEVVELALQRAQADAEYRADAIEDLKNDITATIHRAEVAESNTQVALVERDASQKRAAALERDLGRSVAGGEQMRSLVEQARQAQLEADARSRELADQLAMAHARLEAIEHTAEHDSTRITSLEAHIANERDARIAAESEVSRLRDELSRRPPLDVLRSLDIDSLMQRNLQAAAAMQSLMQYMSPRIAGDDTSHMRHTASSHE